MEVQTFKESGDLADRLIAEAKARAAETGKKLKLELPPGSSLVEQLAAKELEELMAIADKLDSLNTGLYPDSGWLTQEYSGTLPGLNTNALLPGQSVTIINEEEERGALRSAVTLIDNPYVLFTVEVKAPDDTWQSINFSAWLFQQIGNTQANPSVPYLTRYDTANNLYGIHWDPDREIPYKGVRITIQNSPYQTTVVPAGIINTATPNTTAHVIFLGIVRRVFGVP